MQNIHDCTQHYYPSGFVRWVLVNINYVLCIYTWAGRHLNTCGHSRLSGQEDNHHCHQHHLHHLHRTIVLSHYNAIELETKGTVSSIGRLTFCAMEMLTFAGVLLPVAIFAKWNVNIWDLNVRPLLSFFSYCSVTTLHDDVLSEEEVSCWRERGVGGVLFSHSCFMVSRYSTSVWYSWTHTHQREGTSFAVIKYKCELMGYLIPWWIFSLRCICCFQPTAWWTACSELDHLQQ